MPPRGWWCGRRLSPEAAIERVYAAGLTQSEAELVLSFFASYYPLTMQQQLDEISRLRRRGTPAAS